MTASPWQIMSPQPRAGQTQWNIPAGGIAAAEWVDILGPAGDAGRLRNAGHN
jgi:hypothetical protein